MTAPDSTTATTDMQRQSHLSCSVFTSFEDLDITREQWDELAEESGGDIYSSYDWCRTWWEFYGGGRELQIYLLRDGSGVVAIFPAFREVGWLGGLPLRMVRLLGCDSTTATCGFVAAKEYRPQVLMQFARTLRAQGGWDLIHLGPLASYGELHEDAEGALQEVMGEIASVASSPAGSQTTYDLEDGFDGYLSDLSKHRRKKLREYDRRIRRNFHIEKRLLRTPHETAEAFERFVELHEKLWQGRSKLGHFRDWPEAKCFHRSLVGKLSEKGRLAFFEMWADGAPIASHYCMRFGKFGHGFLSARDDSARWRKWNVGELAFTASLMSEAEDGVKIFERGRGHYSYKLRQGGRLGQMQQVLVQRRSLLVKLAMLTRRAAAWVLHTGYYRLWFKRVGPRCRLLRGPLWKAWIRSGP